MGLRLNTLNLVLEAIKLHKGTMSGLSICSIGNELIRIAAKELRTLQDKFDLSFKGMPLRKGIIPSGIFFKIQEIGRAHV